MASGTSYREWVRFLVTTSPYYKFEKLRETGAAELWGLGRSALGRDPIRSADTPRSVHAAYEAIWNQLNFDPAPSGTLYNQAATFTATGTLAVTRQMIFGIVRPFAATGTLAVGKWIAKGVSFTATGTLTRQRLISVSKAFAATGSLAVTASKAFFVVASMAATGTLAVAKQLFMGVARTFSAVGTLVTGQSFIPGAIGPAILAEYVRRFFTYLGRRW